MLCDLERSQAEPFDGREDVIGFGQGFGILVHLSIDLRWRISRYKLSERPV